MGKNNGDAVRNIISRRQFLRLTALVGSSALLAACGAQATPQETEKVAEKPAEEVKEVAATEEAKEAAPEQEAVVMSWWNPFSPDNQTDVAIGEVIKGFQQIYPWVTVEYEVTGGPPGGGDYIEVLLSRIAAGNPPETATVWTPPSQFGARGSLTAIDDFMDNAEWGNPDAFFEGPLKSCQWRGKTYGLPASAGAGSIYISVPKFEEKGISAKREDFPTTWEDLKALSAEFVVWEGDELKQAGFVPWTESWLKPVWSGLNGGKLFDSEQEQYVVDSESNIEWLEFWVKWLDEQYRGDIEQLNLYGNWPGVGPETAFNLGQSAMSQGGSWSPTLSEFTFPWEVTKFPMGPSGTTLVTGFWPNWWVIPNGAQNLEEAFLFCEYFCTKGWEIWYQFILDTPAWREFPSGVLTKKLVDQEGQERAQDIHDFFATYLEDTVEMWNSPVEDFASDTLDALIDEVLHKSKTPANALKEAQDIIQAELEKTLAG